MHDNLQHRLSAQTQNQISSGSRKGVYLSDHRKSTYTIQRKANSTGLPDNLKAGIENLSGIALDDVKVHYNSSAPTQLNAHAYAQGRNIHIAPGQEKHLPHEAWHIVQQKQGRVKPTAQLKGKVNVNDDAGLEKEADTMGAKALSAMVFNGYLRDNRTQGVTQRKSPGSNYAAVTRETDTIQMISNVQYYAKQTYQYTNPPAAGGAVNTAAQVGNTITAKLDLTDPVSGSGVGGGQIPAGLMADLALKHPAPGWVQGHLLNSNLGGQGLGFNLFPITVAANANHTSVEHEVKELLYNQPPAGNFNLVNNGYVEYNVAAVPVGGINTATTAAPDADFHISYRNQISQPAGAAIGPPVWNPPKSITITSRAGGSTPVPANWAPFGGGLGLPVGAAINVMLIPVQQFAVGTPGYNAALVAALGGAPVIPGGAVHALIQQTGAAAPTHKIVGWQF